MNPHLEELYRYHKYVSTIISEMEPSVADLEADPNDDMALYKVVNALYSMRNDAEFVHHFNEELIRNELMRTDAPIHRNVEQIAEEHQAFDKRLLYLLTALSGRGSSVELTTQVRSYLENYQDHMQGEDTIFFPMAEKWLSDEHWQRIEKEWLATPTLDPASLDGSVAAARRRSADASPASDKPEHTNK